MVVSIDSSDWAHPWSCLPNVNVTTTWSCVITKYQHMLEVIFDHLFSWFDFWILSFFINLLSFLYIQAEKDARSKDKEINELMGKLHKYESKIIGLPEAVAEIKDCKLQIQIRDRYEIIVINSYLLYYTVCKSFSLALVENRVFVGTFPLYYIFHFYSGEEIRDMPTVMEIWITEICSPWSYQPGSIREHSYEIFPWFLRTLFRHNFSQNVRVDTKCKYNNVYFFTHLIYY